jgi:putative ABC transport system permease protein
MLRNLFITAVRSLLKNKFFSVINIFGLSIGMAVFLLIAQYTRFEHSYENFVPGKENVYRVKLETFNNNERILSSAENYPGVGPALKNEIPEVVRFARLYNQGYKNNVIITNKEAKPDPIAFKQKRFLYADSSFLPMMGYEMAKGNASTALVEPFTAVISESYAKLYFKNEEPIGKTLLLQDDDFNYESVKVTGVFKDLPENTHMKFDVLFSYQTLYNRYAQAPARYFTGWGRKDMYVFVQLRPGTDPAKVESRFPGIVNKYKPQQQARGAQKDVISLQPLTDIHLKSDLAEEAEANGNERIVFFMGLIGIFVLVIAWINYVNLSTARALERAKEVGIRKVVGAIKAQLINQFLVESAFVNLISVLLAWGIVFLSLSFFNTLSGQSLTASYLVQPWFLLLLGGLWLVSTVLSGFYPAIVLSSFKPVTVLKGKLKNNVRGIVLRKGLVVMQFMASIALIAGTIVVYRQLNYMMNRDMGMNIDQVLVIERPGIQDTNRNVYRSNIEVFRNQLKQNPTVTSVAASLTVPGKQREYKLLVKNNSANSKDSTIMRLNGMDYDFLDVFKMRLIAGRNFSRDYPRDLDTACILTESAAKLLGFKTPQEAINKPVRVPAFNFSTLVIGVVNDYHQVSLKKPLDPTFFFCDPDGGEYYSIRLNTSDLPATLEHVRKSWTKAFPGNPFEYFFLDDYFNRQYSNERKFGKLFTAFAILAIFIGCLGLFGLSAYTASQRIKEIGIRKVLGASVTDITAMLSRDFIKLVGISVLIATPIAWYVMHNWLQEFAYRTSISWWIFAVAGLAALFIALITVSFQAIKAALANPVKSLRTE